MRHAVLCTPFIPASLLLVAILPLGAPEEAGPANLRTAVGDPGFPHPHRVEAGPSDRVVAPPADYWVYVGSEGGNLVHRVRFGPEGAGVEGALGLEVDAETNGGPRALVISPDGRDLYVTTGQDGPEGRLWKFALSGGRVEDDRLADGPIPLGPFPASIDISPDGSFLYSPNFNLRGDRVPSTLSVTFGPDLFEVERLELCTMPHGARVSPSGNHVYTVCMMDDQLVEVDALSIEVVRRFSVSQGREGPLPAELERGGPGMATEAGAAAPTPGELHGPGTSTGMTCAPTWAEPSPDGRWVYVACNGTDEIHEVDLEGWRVRRSFRTGRGPYNLAVTPDGRLLVATLRQGSEVEVFELESGFSIARVPTSGPGAHGVAVTPDGRYAFVSVEGAEGEPGKVDVLDLEGLERVADVEVGPRASGIVFWRMEPR
jgi:DNA-binding beta-propeller fold protein YncE